MIQRRRSKVYYDAVFRIFYRKKSPLHILSVRKRFSRCKRIYGGPRRRLRGLILPEHNRRENPSFRHNRSSLASVRQCYLSKSRSTRHVAGSRTCATAVPVALELFQSRRSSTEDNDQCIQDSVPWRGTQAVNPTAEAVSEQ